MAIQAILFDIDDTLYDSSRLSRAARQNAVEAMVDAGFTVEAETVRAALADIVARLGANSHRHFDELMTALGLAPSPRIVAAGIVAYHETKYSYLTPFEETVPTLLALRQRGYRLGGVTNGKPVKQREKLIRLGLQYFFRPVSISAAVGFAKPAPEIFQAACRELGLAPAACAFVGNDPAKDIGGADAVGMFTVRLRKGRYASCPAKGTGQEARRSIDKLKELLDIFV